MHPQHAVLGTERSADGAAEIQTAAAAIAAEIGKAVKGKSTVVWLATVALLAEGHLLIEDVPGTGKTTLAKALARCTGAGVSRIQFTPDLMPSDVTGVSIYNRSTSAFEFRPGPVFSHILVADEINRASPKTQSALLEAMEERTVTVDGKTYQLPRPFLVLATQNPVEMEGTFPLPEAQRDRFLARTALGYPDREAELAMIAGRETHDPLDDIRTVVTAEQLAVLAQAVRSVHMAAAVRGYLMDIVTATRAMPEIRLGASPRAGLHLAQAAKASAAIAGRDYVLPDDIATLAPMVLGHRLLLTADAHAVHRSGQLLMKSALTRIRVPRGAG